MGHFSIIGKYTEATIYAESIEPTALKQIYEMTNNPAFTSPIAIMPDVHAGKGSVIGFTMPFDGKVIPSVVGVDIGCGMTICTFNSSDIKYSLEEIDKKIRSVVPLGKNYYNKPIDVNTLVRRVESNMSKLYQFTKKYNTGFDYDYIFEDYIECILENSGRAGMYGCGSLGGGNHFIELDIHESYTDKMSFVIHSGSRYFGLYVCELWERFMKYKGLDYLSDRFAFEYLFDMFIAEHYASMSRELMMNNVLDVLGITNHSSFKETVHNYISFDEDEIIIRKGAISARQGKEVLIPLNMKDGSLLCIGKGNPDWNYSAPHGAGRLYSRGEAKRSLSMEVFNKEMSGIYVSNLSESLLDESPMAYKDGSEIEHLICDTVEVIDHLKPVLNIK